MLFQAFQKTLSDYNNKFSFKTPEEMQETVTTIAQQTSHLYARLLTSEGHDERDPQARFCHYPLSFPSKEEVDLFETQLAKEIVKELLPNQSSEKSYIKLTTDYRPEECLLNVLSKCNISRNSQFHKYFPSKTYTMIKLDSKLQTLEVQMLIKPNLFG